MARIPDSCHDGHHMKSRLCYAWFGDEDVKQILSALDPKIPTDGAGETVGKPPLSNEIHRREIRREPPLTQPLFKRP